MNDFELLLKTEKVQQTSVALNQILVQFYYKKYFRVKITSPYVTIAYPNNNNKLEIAGH